MQSRRAGGSYPVAGSITDARTVAARQSETVAGLTAEVHRAAERVAALA